MFDLRLMYSLPYSDLAMNMMGDQRSESGEEIGIGGEDCKRGRVCRQLVHSTNAGVNIVIAVYRSFNFRCTEQYADSVGCHWSFGLGNTTVGASG